MLQTGDPTGLLYSLLYYANWRVLDSSIFVDLPIPEYFININLI